MPLTSVQISSRFTCKAAATIAAVKSEPPRPKVVTSPDSEVEINPGRIVIR